MVKYIKDAVVLKTWRATTSFKQVCTALLLCCSVLTNAQQKTDVLLFKPDEVKLLPGMFKDAEQTDLKYMLAMNPDRLLSPYLREAGLMPKAKSYPNWENTGLDGHMGGHYLTALSLMYAATGDQRVGERLTYMLSELKRCQDKNGNGYIGGVPGGNVLWSDISKGKIDAGSFDLNKKWVPLYNIHKIYGGLRDAWLYTANLQAKAMLIKYSEWFLWLTANLSDQQIQQLLKSEHGGLNEVFADVYSITGNKQYLELAYKFSHQAILVPLEQGKDQLSGIHANTQIPKIIGFKRIADLNKDSLYNAAAHFFWETVVNHRSVVNGGNSVREHFNPANDFSTMISSVEGPETCNSYNMLKLTKLFYTSDGLPSYVDYYERTLYNHILSTQHPGDGGFVYFTPMRPGHYRVYSKPETSFWCCVGSGLENHAKYSELIYAYQGNNLYLNLFIPSRLNWKEKGLTFTQETNFPESEKTIFKVVDGKASNFTLNIRYPAWVAAGALQLAVNGKAIKITAKPGAYATITRVWKKGDQVEVVLPMKTRTEQMPDGSKYVAVMYGPVLLAAKTDTTNLDGLYADDSRMGHIAKGKQYPLQDMPLFVTDDNIVAAHIHAIPGKKLSYSASALIYPASYKKLELVPFYKIHDARYVIYWQQETSGGLAEMRTRQAQKEEAAAKLAAVTVDLVYPGEQQPESDHFFKGEQSTNGTFRDRHWRSAKGWFSYELTDKQQKGSDKGQRTDDKEQQRKTLRLTYYGKDKERNFKILVNDQEIANVNLDGSKGDLFYVADYKIPAGAIKQSDSKMTVMFVALNGTETAGIYEVRLMK